MFLLLEDPGGLPGPLLTGTVVLGGGGATAEDTGGVGPDLVSSFSDLRLMGAENKETINILYVFVYVYESLVPWFFAQLFLK